MAVPVYSFWKNESGSAVEGAVTVQGREGSVEITKIDHEVNIPEDRFKGTPTGVRVHKPVNITAIMDSATPYFFDACVRGKNFESVEFKFYRITDTGKEEEYYNILLEQVRVIGVKTYQADMLDPNMDAYNHHVDVKLRYQKIIQTYIDGNITFSDKWEERETV